VVGHIRVSTETQDVKNQRHEILEYADSRGHRVDEFIEIEISSRKDSKTRGIDGLLEKLQTGDVLIVSELSRIGRSVIEIISIVNSLITRKVRFVAIKQGFDLKGDHDIQTKVMITIFSLLAELERDLISERTRKSLAAKRTQGVRLGRPKGSLGRSKLDSKVPEILELLKDKASHAFIARRMRVCRTTLVTDALLEEMTRTIVETAKPRRVILFGSRARGDARPESDVDILVVEDEPFGPQRSRRKEMAKLWHVLSRFDMAKDILVYAREEVEKWEKSRNHVVV
jgi:DNA invertase Pin-like site-specific DNA recombinase